MPIFDAVWNFSDTVSRWNWTGIPSAQPRNKAKSAPADKKVPLHHWAAAGYEFTRESESLMRNYKFLEPACLALSMLGYWKGGTEAAFLLEGTRKVITSTVRPCKAINAWFNSERGGDESDFEWYMRARIAPLFYGLLAVGTGLTLASKRGIIQPLDSSYKSVLNPALAWGGAIGNVMAGIGGGVSWYLNCKRIAGEKKDHTVMNKDLSKLEERRFKDFCNAIRYLAEGAIGFAVLYRGMPFEGSFKLWAKGLPASVGFYQTWVSSWMKTA